MSEPKESFNDRPAQNITRRSFMLRASVLATSAALFSLSPVGRAIADWADNGRENSELLERLLLQENCLAFNGERCDPVTGLYHLGQGYRAYNPRIMRFHAADSLSPFGEGGINPYAYCLGNPVNLIDPTGKNAAAIGGVVGGVLGIVFAIALAVASFGTLINASVGIIMASMAGLSTASLALQAASSLLLLGGSVALGAGSVFNVASTVVGVTAPNNLDLQRTLAIIGTVITGIGVVATLPVGTINASVAFSTLATSTLDKTRQVIGSVGSLVSAGGFFTSVAGNYMDDAIMKKVGGYIELSALMTLSTGFFPISKAAFSPNLEMGYALAEVIRLPGIANQIANVARL
ncbi:RHS repeat-associated core domain-containing protein [Vibrio sp. Isolate23]|uniref:RHS repeat-associated core domain-containing protein n=1 Tax=Vibrio sp. Isolate23 TaxID=2908533 RepID=UPI001EFC611C|nr:RHS repeat-associated core domain-containing protein [Vibrio sp. Isolate23]MCG9685204.1 RHS repeat-associated core domain-containing protein [Vibrio sp. Isolate23]